jgi:hypothetical protein
VDMQGRITLFEPTDAIVARNLGAPDSSSARSRWRGWGAPWRHPR